MKKFRDLLTAGINEDIQGTAIERLVQVKKIFEAEMIYNNRRPNAELLTQWLQGLCSTIYIPYMNDDIIEWYESHLSRKIEQGVPVRGKARYETLLDKYWPQCGRTLYEMLYK
jgi:hypothetical protein